MRARRDLEAVVFGKGGVSYIPAGFIQRALVLLVKDIAEALVEQQRKDELLVVARIDDPAQEHGRTPEVGFELLLGDAGGAHISNPALQERPLVSPQPHASYGSL